MHCSPVANGIFADGKRVSVNILTKEMRLVHTKLQSDGSKLQKIESFTSEGVNSGLYLDGVRVSDINKRFNLTHDDQDWLSLRPSGARYLSGSFFGEINAKNSLHGRGIEIDSKGNIAIQHWDNCGWAPGYFIWIMSDGYVSVGEWYLEDGEMRSYGTRYLTDGTSSKFIS